MAAEALARGDAGLLFELARTIRAQRSEHLVGHWLEGLAKIAKGEVDQWMARLRALDAAGIGRRIPLSAELRALLNETPRRPSPWLRAALWLTWY